MKTGVLVVEPHLDSFAVLHRRLIDRFDPVWAVTFEEALRSLRAGNVTIDAVLVRADSLSGLEFIAQATKRHPHTPVVAIAPWEVQGDRACARGAKEWVSSPINFPHLLALLDVVSVAARSDREGTGSVLSQLVTASV